MNEYVAANRRRKGDWSGGNDMKRRDQKLLAKYIPAVRFDKVWISYHFFEPNRRRDKDNICSYFMKIFQDTLVEKGVLKNDGWDCIEGFDLRFSVDSHNPRIEVTITEWKNES